MKRFIYVALSGFLFISLFLSFNSGPYPENTGAPGEMTCFRSGCHTGSTSGSKIPFISFSDTSKTYRNDSTYIIHFGIETSTSGEFGVQMVALDENQNNIGTWSPMGNQLQVISGFSFPNRRYIQHTLAGSASSSWVTGWKAPATYNGKVTFYASFLETNNNNMNNGDTLYKKVLNLAYNPTASLSPDEPAPLKVFMYNGELRLVNTTSRGLHTTVVDINGRIVKTFELESGTAISQTLPGGIYIVVVRDDDDAIRQTRKIFIP